MQIVHRWFLFEVVGITPTSAYDFFLIAQQILLIEISKAAVVDWESKAVLDIFFSFCFSIFHAISGYFICFGYHSSKDLVHE